jgi:hypothetical protein
MTATALEHSSADELRSDVSEQRILAVEFRSDDGRSWNAIGGGATVVAAIASAQNGCPDDAIWTAVVWNGLYGD